MILDFFLPSPCLYCSKVGAILCSNCLDQLQLAVTKTQLAGLPLFYYSNYEPVAKLVNAVKENGFTAAIAPLAKSMGSAWPVELANTVLVPVPSSAANTRLRGFSHTGLFARALAKEVPGLTVRDLLLSAKARQDQAGLNPEARRLNMEGAFRVSVAPKPSQQLVIFDDVVTTGSSLTEAARTLQSAGLVVAGFCVFARVLGPESQY